MPNVEKIPIEIFIQQVLATKSAQQITDSWPLKLEIIQGIVVKHFHDIGLYTVSPFNQSEVIRAEILFFLQNSAHIMEMIDKAKRAAAAAAQRGKSSHDV